MNNQWVVRGPLFRSVDALDGSTACGIGSQSIDRLGGKGNRKVAGTKELSGFFDSLGFRCLLVTLLVPPFGQRQVPGSLTEPLNGNNSCRCSHGGEESGTTALPVAGGNASKIQLDVRENLNDAPFRRAK